MVSDDPDRGQMYTLEGVIGALVIISAVVFAMQSVVLTPASGGDVGPQERIDLRNQAEDVLVLSVQNDTFDLSRLTRYWSQSKRTFYGGLNPRLGYGTREPPGAIGTILNETFASQGRQYNLHLRYRPADPANHTRSTPVVYQGTPGGSAVVATQTITLFDNQTLTAPGTGNVELWQYDTDPTDSDDGYYPIPNAIDGPVYNVVEVRLVVW
jgi:hypothetical protein